MGRLLLGQWTDRPEGRDHRCGKAEAAAGHRLDAKAAPGAGEPLHVRLSAVASGGSQQCTAPPPADVLTKYAFEKPCDNTV